MPTTLELAKSFESAGFNAPQAQALASVTGGIETRLASLENGIRKMRQEMRVHRQDMQTGFSELRQVIRDNT